VVVLDSEIKLRGSNQALWRKRGIMGLDTFCHGLRQSVEWEHYRIFLVDEICELVYKSH
jgi:hypothetical protein